MNRNTESHFSLLPHADISRSRFDRSSSVKTTFNVGDVIPFFVDEVLPGDTFDVQTSKVVRLQTLLTPVMDNLYLDTYFFFVPNRLVWDHWKEFCGENTESAWIPQTEYSVPRLVSPYGSDDKNGWNVGTIADYMGIPTGVKALSVNALPFRAYALIMNEWFRDQNLQDPLLIPTDDATVTGVNTGTFVTDVAKGGKPYKAAKYHDYFTSCLPSPQKGPDVTVPLAQSGYLPVLPRNVAIPDSMIPSDMAENGPYTLSGLAIPDAGTGVKWNVGVSSAGPRKDTSEIDSFYWELDTNKYLSSMNAHMVSGGGFSPTNLWAYTDGTAVAATINQLRLAFQIQKFYEQQARGGSRYTEVVRSFFGVTSPDARLQRPEYLGGNRVPITINQVVSQAGVANSEGALMSPLGDVAGQSLTTDSHSDFLKSFTEHGFVIGVMVARYDHTYQQGLNRMWNRRDKFDYYWPVFANIGEQAVLNKEIYAQGAYVTNADNQTIDSQVFGYQEAWAEYRYKPSIVTGEMRSQYAQSLDSWHFADYYSQLPTLSESWIQEDKTNVDRALAVTSSLSNQLFCDIYVKNYVTRPMPMYSIPGLIDHH